MNSPFEFGEFHQLSIQTASNPGIPEVVELTKFFVDVDNLHSLNIVKTVN